MVCTPHRDLNQLSPWRWEYFINRRHRKRASCHTSRRIRWAHGHENERQKEKHNQGKRGGRKEKDPQTGSETHMSFKGL